MHGLINRSIECFLRDTYGAETWGAVTREAGLGFDSFEPMLTYECALTEAVITTAAHLLKRSRETLLEDFGTYLVSHPNLEALRRLLRFGGVPSSIFCIRWRICPGGASWRCQILICRCWRSANMTPRLLFCCAVRHCGAVAM